MLNSKSNQCPICGQSMKMCNVGKIAVCFRCKNIFKKKSDSKFKFPLSEEYEILEIK